MSHTTFTDNVRWIHNGDLSGTVRIVVGDDCNIISEIEIPSRDILQFVARQLAESMLHRLEDADPHEVVGMTLPDPDHAWEDELNSKLQRVRNEKTEETTKILAAKSKRSRSNQNKDQKTGGGGKSTKGRSRRGGIRRNRD